MTDKTFSSKSNAVRDARKKLGSDTKDGEQFTVAASGDRFIWRPRLTQAAEAMRSTLDSLTDVIDPPAPDEVDQRPKPQRRRSARGLPRGRRRPAPGGRMTGLSRPKVKLHARAAMTPARKRRIHADHLGRCEECGKRLPVDGPEVAYDHIVALALGGADDDANLQPLCTVPCHARKTAHDVAAIAKAKRLARETCTTKPRRQIPTRPRSDRCRGFDGKIKITKRAQKTLLPTGAEGTEQHGGRG